MRRKYSEYDSAMHVKHSYSFIFQGPRRPMQNSLGSLNIGLTLSQKYRDFPKYATECSLEVVIWNGMVRGFFPNYVAGDFKVPLIVPHYC